MPFKKTLKKILLMIYMRLKRKKVILTLVIAKNPNAKKSTVLVILMVVYAA